MFLMIITFIALPYYILRTKKLLKLNDDEKSYLESKKWGNDFLGIRGKRIETIGVENYNEFKNCIFVSNHQSHNDIFILLFNDFRRDV